MNLAKYRSFFAVLAIVIVTQVSCRKAVEDDSIYVGQWVSRDNCYDHIDITTGSQARYYVTGNSKECYKGTDYSGEFRVNKNSFKIGDKKFELVSDPLPIDVTSMQVDFKTVEVIATMTIRKPVLFGSHTVKMFKIKS